MNSTPSSALSMIALVRPRRLTGIAGHEVRAIGFDQVALRYDAERPKHFAQHARHRRLTGARIAGEDRVQTDLRAGKPACSRCRCTRKNPRQLADLSLDRFQSDQIVERFERHLQPRLVGRPLRLPRFRRAGRSLTLAAVEHPARPQARGGFRRRAALGSRRCRRRSNGTGRKWRLISLKSPLSCTVSSCEILPSALATRLPNRTTTVSTSFTAFVERRHFSKRANELIPIELVGHRQQILQDRADFVVKERAAPQFVEQHLRQLPFLCAEMPIGLPRSSRRS